MCLSDRALPLCLVGAGIRMHSLRTSIINTNIYLALWEESIAAHHI